MFVCWFVCLVGIASAEVGCLGFFDNYYISGNTMYSQNFNFREFCEDKFAN